MVNYNKKSKIRKLIHYHSSLSLMQMSLHFPVIYYEFMNEIIIIYIRKIKLTVPYITF